MKIFRYFKILIDYYHRLSKGGSGYARYKGVQLGEDCRILTTTLGTEPWLIKIGNRVTVTSGVRFLTHDGATWLIRDDKGRRQLFRRIEVGNNVFIGINSIIMPGVKIEDNVIIASGSVVTKSIPKNTIVGGNPARVIGDYDVYKHKVLETFISNSEIDMTESYKTQVDKALDTSFKPFVTSVKEK